MSKQTTFRSKGGGEAHGIQSEPSGNGTAPGLVVIQEYWGINDQMKAITDRFAAEGFLAIAPDLYHGKVTKDAAEAAAMMQALDGAGAIDEIAGAVAFLRAHPRCSGKVGVIGFCMGGAFAFRAACAISDLDAVVPFYGVPDPSKVDYAKVNAPIQAHFSKTDPWAAPAAGEAIKKQLEARGQTMELHLYDAAHAFMNERRPEVYDATAAKLAWGRAIAFLKKNLA